MVAKHGERIRARLRSHSGQGFSGCALDTTPGLRFLVDLETRSIQENGMMAEEDGQVDSLFELQLQ